MVTQSQSLRGLFASAANFVSQLNLGFNQPGQGLEVLPYEPLSGAPSCPLDGPLSCHNSTPVADSSCCFIYPGGRMLLTQFWDEDVHASDTEEDWTIHGLWPDHCDGGFDSFCSVTPQYHNITHILKARGQDELLAFMDKYWVADRGSNEHLWTHEYNKHATCINTLAASCYTLSSSSSSSFFSPSSLLSSSQPSSSASGRRKVTGAVLNPGEMAVVDYFTRATALFKMLDTYTALQQAGITPHGRTRYPLVDVRDALERYVGGGKVVLRCAGSRRDILREAWYHYFVQGSLQTGEFVPARSLGRGGDEGNCAPWVRYLPKKMMEEL